MKYMLLIYDAESRWDEMTEADNEELYAAYGAFHQEVKDSGVFVAGAPLQPTSTATTVRVRDDKPVTTDGPFAETKELLAGFWLWRVASMEEAVEWLKRAPFDGGTEIEIRPVFETEDFAESDPSGEIRERERRLRERIESPYEE